MKNFTKILSLTALAAGLAFTTSAQAGLSLSAGYFSQDYGNDVKATGTRFSGALTLGIPVPYVTFQAGPEFSYATGSVNYSYNNSRSYHDFTLGAVAKLRLDTDFVQPYFAVRLGYSGASFGNSSFAHGTYYGTEVGLNIAESFSIGLSYRYTTVKSDHHEWSGSNFGVTAGLSF